jgi:hypothetical protein
LALLDAVPADEPAPAAGSSPVAGAAE